MFSLIACQEGLETQVLHKPTRASICRCLPHSGNSNAHKAFLLLQFPLLCCIGLTPTLLEGCSSLRKIKLHDSTLQSSGNDASWQIDEMYYVAFIRPEDGAASASDTIC